MGTSKAAIGAVGKRPFCPKQDGEIILKNKPCQFLVNGLKT
jgi:hypothetical protein